MKLNFTLTAWSSFISLLKDLTSIFPLETLRKSRLHFKMSANGRNLYHLLLKRQHFQTSLSRKRFALELPSWKAWNFKFFVQVGNFWMKLEKVNWKRLSIFNKKFSVSYFPTKCPNFARFPNWIFQNFQLNTSLKKLMVDIKWMTTVMTRKSAT